MAFLRSTHRFVGVLFTVILMVWIGFAHADTMPPVSGVISIATEPVTIKTTSTDGKVSIRTAGVGQPIYLNDEIKTGPNNKLQILLKDQTVFNVGPNSVMTIDKFVFDPTKGELAVGIQKGAFKFVSGKVSNSSPDAMKVKLPNATISVRGTGVAGTVAPDGASTVVLLHGTVDVTGSAGSSTLSKSGWGVQVGPTGAVGQPIVIPPDVTKNIITSVAQIKAPASSTSSQTAQGGSPAQINSTLANTNSTDPSNALTSSTLASIQTDSKVQSSLNGSSALALTASQENRLLQAQSLYITTFCATCGGQSGDAFYDINILKNPNLFGLGPLGTVSFTGGGSFRSATEDIQLTQTLLVNFSNGVLTNTYNIVDSQVINIPFRPPSLRVLGTFACNTCTASLASLSRSGSDPHIFILPTNPSDANLQMTAALGNAGYGQSGQVASLGFVLNTLQGNTVSGVRRSLGVRQ
jgi:hypothetical protein